MQIYMEKGYGQLNTVHINSNKINEYKQLICHNYAFLLFLIFTGYIALYTQHQIFEPLSHCLLLLNGLSSDYIFL